MAATLDRCHLNGGHLNGHLNDAPVSSSGTEKRQLLRNLRAPALFSKIREAERRMEAGERELGFYLLDLKRRKLYKDGTCTTFNEFIRGKTGLTKKKAADLVRVSRALELLPLMNEAFNQGRLYWTAVRAMAAVATAQTEAEWIAYARGHRVEEVERKVASSKAGEGPDDDRWGRRPVRYPYHFTVNAEVHQAYESLTAVLSLRFGKELTVDEALFIAARDRIAAEIEKDGKDGEERKLPSAYRLVLKECPLCEEICVPTADGPVAIPRERAEKLLEGAEVLDLTRQGEEAKTKTKEMTKETTKELPAQNLQNCPIWDNSASEVLVNSDTHKNYDNAVPTAENPTEKSDSAQAHIQGASTIIQGASTMVNPVNPSHSASEAPSEVTVPSAQNLQNCPIWDNSASEVLVNSDTHKKYGVAGLQPLGEAFVEHASNLSTPNSPSVPKEERDRPNSPKLQKEVLNRDGFACRIPGCGCLATEGHHIQFREKGGRTVLENLAGLCEEHHSLIHDGLLLASGTGEKLILSDSSFRPLLVEVGVRPPSVELEAEPPPDPVSASLSTSEAALQACALPDEISAEWWRRHRACMEYSERVGAWVFDAEKAAERAGDPTERAQGKSSAASLPSFVGQKAAVDSLSIAVKAANMRGELPPPILISGPPGLGKTTLANRVAVELGGRLHIASGAVLTSFPALVDVLSELRKGDVLFIDEIHGLETRLAECLYQAIDEKCLSIPVSFDSGVRLFKLKLEPFLLVGATTEESRLPKPFRSRFGIHERLDYYSRLELEEIGRRASGELGVTLTAAGASVLAAGSRGTPRTLHALLGRARDLAQVEKGSLEDAVIDSRISERALRSQGIDASGLSRLERRILEALVSRMRPMGLRSLADMIGESRETVASVYEPYLFREGYLARTQRGRVATERAREALKRDPEARPTAALSCGPLPGGIRVLRIRWLSGAKAS